jgi:hypothetical protein
VKISSTGVLQWKRGFVSLPASSIYGGSVKQSTTQTILAAGCVDQGTDNEDVILVNLPISGNPGTSCPVLPTAAIGNAAAPFVLTAFAISTLPATLHSQTIPLTSANLASDRRVLCSR